MWTRRVKIALDLPFEQAHALAEMAKRFGLHHAKMLSSEFTRYGDEAQHDVMLDAVMALQRALAEKGVAPR